MKPAIQEHLLELLGLISKEIDEVIYFIENED